VSYARDLRKMVVIFGVIDEYRSADFMLLGGGTKCKRNEAHAVGAGDTIWRT
jgi:hypothetical protein